MACCYMISTWLAKPSPERQGTVMVTQIGTRGTTLVEMYDQAGVQEWKTKQNKKSQTGLKEKQKKAMGTDGAL